MEARDLLGGTDGRIGQRKFRPVQTLGRGQAQPLGPPLDVGPELAQHIEVIVDRAFADPATAEVGDEGLSQAVQ